jgi:rubrerythrin
MTYDSDYEYEEGDLEIDLEMLRDDLIGELRAINQYQEHIDTIDDDEAREVLEHIRDDEKEHVAQLTKLIQKLDPLQAEMFKKEGL